MLHTTHVGSPDLSGVNHIEGGGGDVVGNRVQSENGLNTLTDVDV
jgi:hypothetical protein